ncbi:OmpP1/FadL family transporter [Vibrio profundi]|uniref:OmpP1/FadL family transporter n=1 Tax=Vibrio profundi TaxID=1774960 RepID=UPI003735EDC4
MLLNRKSLIALSIFAASNAMAGAYVFPELGMMSVSTAGAGAQAIAEGAETAFANPAAMTRLETDTIAFNFQGMVSQIDYTDTGSTGIFDGGAEKTSAGTKMPAGSFYYVKPVNDKFSVGFALASAGGSAIDYGPNFSGSVLLQDATLMTVQLNPSVAYKVNDELSIGLGLVGELGYLKQNFAGSRDTMLPALQGSGDSVEFGYTISAHYETDENNRYGIVYRSETNHDMDGKLESTESSTDASFNFIMPAMALISGYHNVYSDLALLWSVGWSDFSKVQETKISLTNAESAIAREWEDTYSVSVGAHYQIQPKLRLEGGVYYETSPQDDPKFQYPDVPTGEIWKFGTGATYDLTSEWRMQMYYEFLYGGHPEIEYTAFDGGLLESQLSGEYSANVHFFGVMMNYRF